MKNNNLNFSIFFLLTILSMACRKENINSNELISRPISPIIFDSEMISVQLDDFLPDSIMADSVFINNQKADFYQSRNTVMYVPFADELSKPILLMDIWAKGKLATVVLKKSEKELTAFIFDPQGKDFKSVQLSGEFNGWTPSKTQLKFQEGKWGTALTLNRGKYQYQIVIDSQWMLDPNNQDSVENGQGGYNSLLTIGSQIGNEPILWTEKYEGNNIILKSQNSPERIIALWNNTLIDSQFVQKKGDAIIISLPPYCASAAKSTLRVFSFNKSGAGNDIQIQLKEGKVPTDLSGNDRLEHQQKIIYNVFVDRFFDGDTTNNRPLPYDIVLPAANFNGGDIAGIKQKIESGYFNELGVNTLWISPVVKNVEGAFGFWPKPETKFSSYHGYWPTSFTQIDSHFGSASEFKSMVELVHKNNLNILVDYVANHVHEDHPYYKANPNCATPLLLPDGRLNLELWDEYRLTTWFDKFLPTLDLGKTDIANMVADSILWWAEEYNLDGFRYDAAKHVPISFWRILTDKLTDKIPNAANGFLYQLGETYGSPELISSYLGNGLLDAQFDFNVYDAALNAFANGGNMMVLKDRMNESLRYYGSHHLMGNITGNQDRGRFISYAGGSLLLSEDAKAAGWTRKIEVGNPIGYDKLNMLMAFNMTIPGVPVIYYGDEFGMPGGNDPDSRRMMRFDQNLTTQEKTNLAMTKKLIDLRKKSAALLYGDFCYQKADKNSLVYARKYFNSIAIVAFNNSTTDKSIEINLDQFTDIKEFKSFPTTDFQIKNNKLLLLLKPNSFIILQNN